MAATRTGEKRTSGTVSGGNIAKGSGVGKFRDAARIRRKQYSITGKMDDLAGKYGADYPPVRDYRKLKGNMEAQETVSCVILMVNSMLRLCEIPAIKRILEADDMDIKSLGTGADGIPGKKTALFWSCQIMIRLLIS